MGKACPARALRRDLCPDRRRDYVAAFPNLPPGPVPRPPPGPPPRDLRPGLPPQGRAQRRRRATERARKPFGPTWDPLAAGRHQGRCLLGVRALPGSHLSIGRHSPSVPSRAEGPTGEPRSASRTLDLAASGGVHVRRDTPWPSGGRRNRGGPPVRRPLVDSAEPTRLRPSAVNTPLTCGVSPNQQVSADWSAAPRHAAASRGHTVRPHAVTAGHPFGRAKTVRPPTTVRNAAGRSPPGVRSGSPGVPERGSVDQLATRSSGAWTRRSPTLQTA